MRISFAMGRLSILSIIIFTLSFIAVRPAAASEIIVVTTFEDGVIDNGNCSLREAVQAANTATAVDQCAAGGNPVDIIAFDRTLRGRITLLSEIRVTDALSIQGFDQRLVGIGGGRSTRLFSAENAGHFELRSIHLFNGSTEGDGGLVYARNTNLEIRKSFLSNGRAGGQGGAVYVDNGRLTVATSTFRNNKAEGNGGAVYTNRNSAMTAANFFNNGSSNQGGAIFYDGQQHLIQSSDLQRNAARESGGAIAAFGFGTVRMTFSTVSNNNAGGMIGTPGGRGGAIFMDTTNLELESVDLETNFARLNGGAIASRFGALSIQDGFLHNNEALVRGGAIESFDNTLSVWDTLILNNRSGTDGGGLAIGDSFGRLVEVAFTGNRAGNNGGAVDSRSTTLNIQSATYLRNEASADGGAFYLDRAKLTLEDAEFNASKAGGRGGAISMRESQLNTLRNEFLLSEAGAEGGTIFAEGDDQVTLIATNIKYGRSGGNGGAIAMTNGFLKFDSGRIDGNHINQNSNGAGYGGGFYLENSSAELDSMTLAYNRALTAGGGVAAIDSKIGGSYFFTESNRVENGAEPTFGGGLYMKRSNGSFVNAHFIGNVAKREGGGVALLENSTLAVAIGSATRNIVIDGFGGAFSARESVLRLAETKIESNQTQISVNTPGLVRWGGAIASLNSQLIVNHSTIRWNSGDEGGAIFAQAGSGQSPSVKPSVSMLYTTINGNHSRTVGGGLSIRNQAANISNSTISGNSAETGSGIFSNNSYIDIRHATIVNNSKSGIASELGTVYLRNSIVANNAAGNCVGQVSGSAYNLSNDDSCPGDLVANPLLGGLTDNGGRTPTHALLPGSPAIDQGEASVCAAYPVGRFDQRLNKRDALCDLGAYEFLD